MTGRSAPRGAQLASLRGFVFDVDGTLVLGDRGGGGYELLPGAVAVLDALKARAIPYVLFTNGSAHPPCVQAPRLRAVGLAVDDAQMLTPSVVAADYLARKRTRRVLVLGSPGVGQPLAENGIETVMPGGPANGIDAVYVGWHPDCTMAHIEAACHAIWAGAKLYIASDVPFFATRSGRTIGYSHAIVAAIRSLTRARATVLGKPSVHALRFCARRLGVPMSEIAVVGDDPKLEIAMARRGGAAAFGVATGLTKTGDWNALPPARRPDRVFATVGELLDAGMLG